MSSFRGGGRKFRGNNKYSEHDDRTVHFGTERKSFAPTRGGFKKRGRPFQKRGGFYESRGRGRGSHSASRLDDDDVDMGGERPHRFKQRHSPYGGVNRRSTWSAGRGRSRGNNRTLQRLGIDAATGAMHSHGQPRNRSDWFRIQVPHGQKIGKEYILSSLSERLRSEFVPVRFHFERGSAVFHIQGYQLSTEIRRLSDQIDTPDGYKIIFIVKSSDQPSSQLTDDIREKLKVCMSQRYDVASKCLNMDGLYNDADLNKEDIFLSMSRVPVIHEVIGIIKANIPELQILKMNGNRLFSLSEWKNISNDAPNIVHLELGRNQLKSEQELNNISKLKLTTLTLDGNPLCDRFNDETSYISAIRKRFPKLEKLDGHVLPPTITFDIETPTSLPAAKDSYLGNDEQAKNIVLTFLKEYFGIYDSDDRQGLLSAYHEHAIFSMSFSFNKLVTGKQPQFAQYSQDSRNLLKVSDSSRRAKQMKSGRLNVVAHLNQLPNTQHDLNSFKVDLCHLSQSLLTFSVSGVYKEKAASSHSPAFRYFTRVFVTAPQGQGIVIVNEELFVTNATQDQIDNSFKAPVALETPPVQTPGVPVNSPASPVAGPSTATATATNGGPDATVKLKMVEQFSMQSEMNAAWSERCLADNGWDYEKSAKMFMELKANNKIPPEAFFK